MCKYIQLSSTACKRSVEVLREALYHRVMDKMIKNWIQQARWASSADNLQPWKVQYFYNSNDVILKLSLRENTLHFPSEIDTNWTLSYLALGCYSKNIELLARRDGFTISKLHISDESPHDFYLKFKPCASQEDSLLSWIEIRGSRRDEFLKQELPPLHQQAFENIKNDLIVSKVQFFATKTSKHLQQLLTTLDHLRYTQKRLFLSFLKTLRLNSQEKNSLDGLRHEDLFVPSFFSRVLSLIQRYNFLWVFNLLGAQYLSTWMGCTRLLKHSSSLVSLQASQDSPRHWFLLGMDLQTFWLKANSIGVSVQVFGNNLLIYRAHIESTGKLANLESLFSKEKRQQLDNLNKTFLNQSNLDARLPLIILRLGYAKKTVTNRSHRRAVACEWDPTLSTDFATKRICPL